jgi:four helix bundle protein
MKDFKKLIVWQKGLELYTDIHIYCGKLPPEEKFGLASQIRRAAFSIPANIAEGSAKATNAHYKLYLENSLGSAYELETALIAVKKIYPLLADVETFLTRIQEIQKMLISFINKLGPIS